MLKKIAASVALAGAVAFALAAPAVVSDAQGTSSTVAIGNWPDPMSNPAAGDGFALMSIGNWPDPM
jgi:uncharacterized low-complexity protein